ncbi:hypothetical protein B0H16DRAFT_1459967 [Mycena metata]|uniref:Uncharacterized protein n=1 Tax=Mycena metata TaxID=1033252 RepID=A0AAD7IX50_9AGAR|nr:hypothetical protein B0H16DRAFT_1459967 [Mycena metata]
MYQYKRTSSSPIGWREQSDIATPHLSYEFIGFIAEAFDLPATDRDEFMQHRGKITDGRDHREPRRWAALRCGCPDFPSDRKGLQVQNLAGDWIDVPPIPGTFVNLRPNFTELDRELSGRVNLIGRIKHPDVAKPHYLELFKQVFQNGVPSQDRFTHSCNVLSTIWVRKKPTELRLAWIDLRAVDPGKNCLAMVFSFYQFQPLDSSVEPVSNRFQDIDWNFYGTFIAPWFYQDNLSLNIEIPAGLGFSGEDEEHFERIFPKETIGLILNIRTSSEPGDPHANHDKMALRLSFSRLRSTERCPAPQGRLPKLPPPGGAVSGTPNGAETTGSSNSATKARVQARAIWGGGGGGGGSGS